MEHSQTRIDLDRSKTSKLFDKYLSGEIVRSGLADSIISIERDNSEIALALDRQAGIDYLFLQGDDLIPAACRIQGGPCWRTFTIRQRRSTGRRTEAEKLLFAERGALMPYYSIQAYIDQNRLLGWAIARTQDILQAIRDGNCEIRRTGDRQASFFVVRWSDLDIVYKKIAA